jgi:hypothetical protein
MQAAFLLFGIESKTPAHPESVFTTAAKGLQSTEKRRDFIACLPASSNRTPTMAHARLSDPSSL